MPLRVLLPPFPVSELTHELPVRLMFALPSSSRFSTLLLSVHVTALCTLSVPWFELLEDGVEGAVHDIGIVAEVAAHRVVAGAAVQQVVAVIAIQGVVAAEAEDESIMKVPMSVSATSVPMIEALATVIVNTSLTVAAPLSVTVIRIWGDPTSDLAGVPINW